MANSKTTRKALVLSLLSLLLCCSMLVGTTFAWFTDSVQSGNNKIVAGNLDVGLQYYDGKDWVDVKEDTNVFEENTLWEPGHTEVVYLKVSNLGTLALDYKLGVNIAFERTSINVFGEELKLSDHIMMGVLEDQDTAFATREAARKALEGKEVKAISEGYAKKATLHPVGNVPADGKTEQYVALVVYMPEEVDNKANYKTGYEAPEITLGINLMATQETYEKDSFDEKYDENAMYAGIPSAKVTKVSAPVTVTTITNNTYPLNVGYVFETTEDYDSAQENVHGKWHADFVATFDQDVPDGAFGLAGQYDFFSTDWLAFEVSGIEIKANEPIRMLNTAGITMNYEELCNLVKRFQCGAFAVDAAAMAGKTMTVELRIFEVEEPSAANGNSWNVETGRYQTIGSYSYTFPYAVENEPIIGDGEGEKYVGDLFDDELTDALVVKGKELTGDATVVVQRTYNTVVLENVKADINGDLVTLNAYNTVVLSDCDITLKPGEKLVVVADGSTTVQVLLHNVTVNGVKLTYSNAAQYLEGVATCNFF